MITVTIGNILGIGINSFVNDEEIEKIKTLLPAQSRIGFIDIAPGNRVMELITILEKERHQVIYYADHHLDPGWKAVVHNTGILQGKLGRFAKIEDRSKAPSCVWLIQIGHWKSYNINVVFFHSDIDGFLGFIKGCGLYYSGLYCDAETIEGAGRGRVLTARGNLLANAHHYLVPSVFQDPEAHNAAKSRIYQIFADWITRGGDPEDIREFSEEVENITQEVEALLPQLMEATAIIADDVAICDFLPYNKQGQPLPIYQWKREVARYHGEVLICAIRQGWAEEQVVIDLPKPWRNVVDLRDFLPNGICGRMPFRVQVPLRLWDKFLLNWKENRDKVLSPCYS